MFRKRHMSDLKCSDKGTCLTWNVQIKAHVWLEMFRKRHMKGTWKAHERHTSDTDHDFYITSQINALILILNRITIWQSLIFLQSFYFFQTLLMLRFINQRFVILHFTFYSLCFSSQFFLQFCSDNLSQGDTSLLCHNGTILIYYSWNTSQTIGDNSQLHFPFFERLNWSSGWELPWLSFDWWDFCLQDRCYTQSWQLEAGSLRELHTYLM